MAGSGSAFPARDEKRQQPPWRISSGDNRDEGRRAAFDQEYRRSRRGGLVWIGAVCVLASSGLHTWARADQDVAADAHYVELVRQLEPWIAAEVEAKRLPALSIALVDDQRIIWARGFGFADAARTVPASADTVYRVGSVSKLFTDLAIMQLVEQGRLDLDAPVSADSARIRTE